MAREKKKIRHAEQKQPQVVLQQNNVQITNEKVANEKQQQQKEPQPNTQNSSKNLDSGYGKDIKGKLIYYLYMDTQILPR